MEFNKSKLAVAIFVATTSLAYANQAETVTKLDVIEVVAENAGAKNKTNVVTAEDVNKSTETDLRGLLSEEPSINFGGGNGTSQWLTIRGMGQDQIDFNVDNTNSDAQIFHHQGRFTLIDPTLIKRINVKKGSGSASAGIGATSGSINVTTLDAKDLLKDGRNFGFKVNGGFSTNKGYTEGGTLFGRVGKVDALVSGNWITEKGYKSGKSNGGEQSIQNSDLGKRGILAKVGVDLTEDQRVVLSHREDRHYGKRAMREEYDQSLVGNDSENNPSYRVTETTTTNLQWTGKNLGFITNIDANAYVKEDAISSSEEKAMFNGKRSINTQGANLNLDSAIGESHMIKYGINWRHQEGKAAKLAKDAHNQEKTDKAVYVEGIWGFGPVTLTTGARYDHFKFTDMAGNQVSRGKLNPSFGLIWEATDNLSLNSSLNYATRSPRFVEVQMANGDRNKVVVADNLKAERARDTEVGFNYKVSDSIDVNGSYFWKVTKDLVQVDDRGAKKIYNEGTLRSEGYELGASYKIGGLTLRAGVADSKPRMSSSAVDSITLAVPTGRTWTTGISYKFDNPDLELGWKGRFVEGIDSLSTIRTRAPIVKRSGYGISDFYVNWKATKDLNVNLALDNAFNKYYRSHSQRPTANSLPGVGRDFRMNVNYTF
ncbi:TonB-dependent receptor [Pasteurellaceae bacterium LFhippo2]|nr:TonB-dependent receptor [Pasteurellaceae bacterium LFhippo2]